jgi:Ca-activated chloride channel family protein
MQKMSAPAGFSRDEVMPAEMFNDFGAGEEYKKISENIFKSAAGDPVSTFSIDVDTASYSNVRRFINSGALPNPDAVRIEELINYFSYDYPQPEAGQPFSFTAELSECPWNTEHQLLHLGLQAYKVAREAIPPTNMVFLIDSSGSMQDENKLPLLKDSMSLLIDTLRPEDRVSIVAYAGSAGLVLPPTEGNNKGRIFMALDDIEAGGSTAGGAGIDLAYKTAAENLFKNGNNRVIIATDGDFNVGQSSEDELKAMIEERRDQGIYLTVLGLGMGNYKDARMEALADNGNGNYAYIDTLNEANKVLVTEMSSTFLTIAKDVKIQIDFNSEAVESYRLVGYENRLMAAEDFNNDKKDAGEIGAGHSVTALYEIIPAKGGSAAEELAQIKFRYKKPDEDQSRLIESAVPNKFFPYERTSDNFRFSAAVAEWGLMLKNSEYLQDSDIDRIINGALGALGQDSFSYRHEFVELLYKTKDLLD